MSGNLEARLRKLEIETIGNGRCIVVRKQATEDADAILKAEGVTATAMDLVVCLVSPIPAERDTEPQLAGKRIVSIRAMAA